MRPSPAARGARLDALEVEVDRLSIGFGQVSYNVHSMDVAATANEERDEARADVVSVLSAGIIALRCELADLRSTACRQARAEVVSALSADIIALRGELAELRSTACRQSGFVAAQDEVVRDLRTRCEVLESEVEYLANRSEGDDRDSDHRYHDTCVALADGYDERSGGVAQSTGGRAAGSSAPPLVVTSACGPMRTADVSLPAGRGVAGCPAPPPAATSESGLPVAAEGYDDCGAGAAQIAGRWVTAMSEVEYLACLPDGSAPPPVVTSASGLEQISDVTLPSGRCAADPLAPLLAATSVSDRSVAAEATLDPPERADIMLAGGLFCMGRDA